MRADLVSVLRCPVCGDGLELSDRTARCGLGHAYDLAKQGYLNLLPSASTGIDGDSAEMVDARAEFLSRGWYAPIREALVDSLPNVEPASADAFLARDADLQDPVGLGGLDSGGVERGPVGGGVRHPLAVEVGAGRAYSLAGVIDAGWRGRAVDVSRYAARRAAKVDPGIGSVVADAGAGCRCGTAWRTWW